MSFPETAAHIIMGVVLIAAFISIFFFTYVSKIESDIVQTQMEKIVDDLTGSIDTIITEQQKEEIGQAIQNIEIPDMSQQDAAAQTNNKDLMQKAIIIFSCIIGIGLLAICLLWYFGGKFHMSHMIIQNSIILILVALTEFGFVTFVTQNYQVIDPNYVRYLISRNLQNYVSA